MVLHLSRPYAAIAEAFIGTPPNWIASPAALRKEGGAKFALHPVGAGPFEVSSNNPGVQLELKRNRHYWQAGHPYLNWLIFSGVGTPASGLEALYAGDDQVYLLINGSDFPGQASIRAHGFKVYNNPPITPLGGLYNTLTPPFNNRNARLAVSYASDPVPINKAFFLGHLTPTQAPTGVLATDFPEPKVPGYPSYDPAKAKALVKELGGLSFTVTTYQSPTLLEYSEALAAQWARVGIHATIDQVSAATIVQDFQNHTWQMQFAGVGGATDPALFDGLSTYYSSSGTESGVHDPTLDQFLAKAASGVTTRGRAAIYKKVFKRIATQDYSLVLGLEPTTNVVSPKVGGWVRWAETPLQDLYLKG